jgi:hypothetical protein
MGLELTDNEAEDLVNRTKRLLEILADAWDPGLGEMAEVKNTYLEEADRLDKRWRAIRWGKSQKR